MTTKLKPYSTTFPQIRFELTLSQVMYLDGETCRNNFLLLSKPKFWGNKTTINATPPNLFSGNAAAWCLFLWKTRGRKHGDEEHGPRQGWVEARMRGNPRQAWSV